MGVKKDNLEEALHKYFCGKTNQKKFENSRNVTASSSTIAKILPN